MRASILTSLLIGCCIGAVSQQPTEQKAQAIAATFNKHKVGVKEKHGVRTTKFKDVRTVTVVRQNVQDYTGVYEVPGLGYQISVQVGSDGRVRANGNENSRAFSLENAQIQGALLTATKVYQGGTREAFEGVFMNRTERSSPTDAGTTVFGLGVVLNSPVQLNGLTYQRMFYQAK